MQLTNKQPINFSIIGTGEWGKRVYNVAKFISRINPIGVINTKTPNEEKQKILSNSDFVYIAVPPESQKEYIDFCISEKKDIICETPFLCTKSQREAVFKELYQNNNNKNIFYINYPYITDQLFIGAAKFAAENDFSFMSVKCSGPKYSDNLLRAKKMYSNQAINIITQIMSMKTYKFDKFIMHNNDFGEFFYRNSTCLFAWGYSDVPILEINIKGKDFSFERKFTYDEYDQIYPLLIVYLNTVRSIDITPTIPRAMSLNALQHSFSAEHFSDIFVALDGQKLESTYENLIFSGNIGNEKFTM